MAIRILKPTTNGQRNMTCVDKSHLTKSPAKNKALLSKGRKIDGRSNGTISIRHRGGGTRSKYRKIDFNGTDRLGIVGRVDGIEYDPNRSAYIALIVFVNGEKRYQLAHRKMKVGDKVITNVKAKPDDGNRMQLKNIPIGFQIFNIETSLNKGGQLVRSAGGSAKLVSLDGDMAQIQLPSGEIRLVPKTCYATIGVLSNEERSLVKVGKAGKMRHRGRRPQVRGKAMNPNDHPHGGGEGGCPIGMKYPKTPWGAHALGVKTRKNKVSDKFILRSRHRAKKK